EGVEGRRREGQGGLRGGRGDRRGQVAASDRRLRDPVDDRVPGAGRGHGRPSVRANTPTRSDGDPAILDASWPRAVSSPATGPAGGRTGSTRSDRLAVHGRAAMLVRCRVFRLRASIPLRPGGARPRTSKGVKPLSRPAHRERFSFAKLREVKDLPNLI